IEGLEAELVGRADELNRLSSVLDNLEKGIGGIVCLLGGAGLGKSRLIRELKSTRDADSVIDWLEISSPSYENYQPYALVQRLIRSLSDLSLADDPDLFWEKVRDLTEQLPEDSAQRCPQVIAALFGLPDPSGQPPLEGELFKRELYALMQELWQRRFSNQPSLLVLEDLHWADSASVDLLLHLLPAVENSPLVLLCSFRPDRSAPSYQVKQVADEGHHHRYTEIRLRPLSDDQSDELVNRLLAIAELPDDLRGRIRERASGNPFFIEEVVRTLIENGAVVPEERSENGTLNRYWRAASGDAVLEIPDSLQGLLAARIDRLEEETRQVVQLASVIGRTFYHRLLAEIGREDHVSMQAVEDQISRLVQQEMIQETARLPELEYRFRNPLMQEIAYQTILLKRRQEFHQRVGAAMEALFPDQLAELAPRLAFHFAEGQVADKALELYTLAGDQAFRLFALENALANYNQAMEWAERSEAGNQQIIHLYRRQGRTLELLLRHDEALETYIALEELGEARRDDALRLAGIASQGLEYNVGQGDIEKARQRSEEALALARELGDRWTEARSLWTLMLALSWIDPSQAQEYGEAGLVIARELVERPEASHEDLELLALILLDLSVPMVGSGQIELARERSAEAQEMFEELGNLPMAATAIQRLGVSYRAEGKFEQAMEKYSQASAIDQSIGNDGGMIGNSLGLLDIYHRVGDYANFFTMVEETIPILAREGRIPVVVFELYRIVAYFHLGAVEQVRQLYDSLLQFVDGRGPIWPDMFLCFAARTYLRAGEVDTARQLLTKIGPDAQVENYLVPLASVYPQARAELALADGDWEEALAYIDEFLEKAHQKGVLAYVPDKLLLKGKILSAAGSPDEAYAVLQEAHALAAEQKARPVLWQICYHLAELEMERGNPAKAQVLKEETRGSIDYIAEHAGGPELRRSFLALPEVQTIVSDTGGELVESTRDPV
ncbi:MAG: AAA family ATPase, partial [Anaerolineales bacterium]|nr:AAA family ATPase [Anaerolineales bacterium]